MIEVRELSKNYNGMPVLNGIDLDINDNETLVILGPSGQGKTVFIKSLVRPKTDVYITSLCPTLMLELVHSLLWCKK